MFFLACNKKEFRYQVGKINDVLRSLLKMNFLHFWGGSLVWVELCPTKFICQSPYSKYLRIQPYMEIGSLQI